MEKISQVSEHWGEIEKTLPAAADRTYVLNRLEQIAQARSSPAELAIQCEEIARLCNELARLVLKIGAETVLTSSAPNEALLEQLGQHGDAAKKQAATYHQIGKVRRPHFLRQCELLWLWEKVGGDLKIDTPRKPSDEATFPPPIGPVIPYFQAAGKTVFGKSLSAWQIKAIVRYYRRRFIAAQLSGEGGMPLDESQIFILREGTLLRAGEENLPENQSEVLRAAREAKSPP